MEEGLAWESFRTSVDGRRYVHTWFQHVSAIQLIYF
jgi:hypothetical protein